MTTPAFIRVRRADWTEVDLPAETEVWTLMDTSAPSFGSLGSAYATGQPSVWIGSPYDPTAYFVAVELPIERAARLERELEKARAQTAKHSVRLSLES